MDPQAADADSESSEPTPAAAADEARHEPGDGRWWSESYYLDFVDRDRGVAGYVRLGILPNQGRCWYWACLVGPDRPLVALIDHDVPLPAAGRHEVRSEGLWADLTVETPLDHVSVGLEAFAVALDRPADVYGPDLRGERLPFGMDLEWETDGGTYAYPGVDRYEVPSRVHGEVIVGQERIEIDGHGQRDHSWGERDWWSLAWSWTAGRMDDGSRLHAVAVDVEGHPLFETGYLIDEGGTMTGTSSAAHTEELDADGLPTGGTWRVGDLETTIEPIAFAPVGLVSDDGRLGRFPRAWTRYTTADGRVGDGWTEWNQPPPPAPA